jgi:RNA polymerase sigma-B factor
MLPPDAASARRAGGLPDSVDDSELARRWRENGDEQARGEIIERYLPMARRLAARYNNPHESREDLVQVASLGLVAAVDRFDPERGAAFPSFAIPTILGEIKRHFRNTGWSVHVPRGAQELAQRVDRASCEITTRIGRPPRVSEIAEFLEIGVEDVVVGLDAGTAHYAASLDAPMAGADADDPHTLADGLGHDDEGLDLVDAKLSFSATIDLLPYLEKTALRLRLEHGLKQSEIGERMGCSQMQVSRLLRRAADRLHALADPAPVSSTT